MDIKKNLEKYLPKGGDIIKKAMRYSVLSGGKHIRPLIVIEASSLCGGSIKDTMPVACAIEFIHSYSLIHDDLPAMDNDDFRRSKPTCHKVFGEANAILAGDALLTLAFNILARHVEPKIGIEIIKEISGAAGVEGMVGGQAKDLEYQNKDKGKDMIRRINILKTARLFEVSAKTGAMVAGASHKKISALQKFGLYFGLSFQTVDDHLDKDSKTRQEAFSLVEKAKKELKIFGNKANRLKTIADFAVKRTI